VNRGFAVARHERFALVTDERLAVFTDERLAILADNGFTILVNERFTLVTDRESVLGIECGLLDRVEGQEGDAAEGGEGGEDGSGRFGTVRPRGSEGVPVGGQHTAMIAQRPTLRGPTRELYKGV
jgi:hypothetical protein